MIFGLKRDNAYIVSAVSTILVGSLVRKIRNVAVKQFIASLLGFTMVIMFCGAESLYSLVSVFVGTCMIKCGKRFVNFITFRANVDVDVDLDKKWKSLTEFKNIHKYFIR